MSLRLALSVFLGILTLSVARTVWAADEEKKEEEAKEAPKESAARLVCEADVFYTWKRLPPPPSAKEAQGQSTQRNTPPPAAGQTKPIEVFYRRVTKEGENEQLIRTLLSTRLSEERGAALSECREQHENSSGCVARKLRSISDQYRTLGFAARKTLLESITSDCQNRQGDCLSTRASELRCFRLTPQMKKKENPKEAPGEEDTDEKGKKK